MPNRVINTTESFNRNFKRIFFAKIANRFCTKSSISHVRENFHFRKWSRLGLKMYIVLTLELTLHLKIYRFTTSVNAKYYL